jgi:hypothetical protein
MWLGLAVVLIAVGLTYLAARATRRRMARYVDRPFRARQWLQRFPEVPKREIRRFLKLFEEAFGFLEKWRYKFGPDDRPMEVYRTLHPPGAMTDDGELEYLAIDLKREYGLDLEALLNDELTLGALFEEAQRRVERPRADRPPKPSKPSNHRF